MIFTPPPPVTNCHTFSDPSPPWSVTYFMVCWNMHIFKLSDWWVICMLKYAYLIIYIDWSVVSDHHSLDLFCESDGDPSEDVKASEAPAATTTTANHLILPPTSSKSPGTSPYIVLLLLLFSLLLSSRNQFKNKPNMRWIFRNPNSWVEISFGISLSSVNN